MHRSGIEARIYKLENYRRTAARALTPDERQAEAEAVLHEHFAPLIDEVACHTTPSRDFFEAIERAGGRQPRESWAEAFCRIVGINPAELEEILSSRTTNEARNV